MQIVDRSDIVRRNALFFHFLTVIRHILPNVLYLRNQLFRLDLSDLIETRALYLFLIIAFQGLFPLYVRPTVRRA